MKSPSAIVESRYKQCQETSKRFGISLKAAIDKLQLSSWQRKELVDHHMQQIQKEIAL